MRLVNSKKSAQKEETSQQKYHRRLEEKKKKLEEEPPAKTGKGARDNFAPGMAMFGTEGSKEQSPLEDSSVNSGIEGFNVSQVLSEGGKRRPRELKKQKSTIKNPRDANF